MQITITLNVPEGTTLHIAKSDEPSPSSPTDDPVKTYWQEYLSSNGRKVYRAAANIETLPAKGPGYTFEHIAAALSITYESAKSMHRTSGRAARVWTEHTGTEPPIRLIPIDYVTGEDQAQRTHYRLPDGIAERIYNEPALAPAS